MLLFRRRWPCLSRAFYSCYADSAPPISISAPSDAKEYLPTRLKAKCSYVKALYGIDPDKSIPDCTVAQLRETQAASLALQSYLHLQRGMAMDDAIFMGENALKLVKELLFHVKEERKDGEGFANYSEVRSSVEMLLLEEGIDDVEPFLESLGLEENRLSEAAAMVKTNPTGVHGLLESGRVLEGKGIDKKVFRNLLRNDIKLLSYGLPDFLHIMEALEHFGVHRTNLSKVVYECPKAFDFNLVEKLKPVVERLEQLQVQKEAIGEILTHAPGKFEKLYGDFGEALHALELCGLTGTQVTKALQAYPLLLVSISDVKVGKLKAFLSCYSIGEEEFLDMIVRYPGILLVSIEKGMRPKIKELEQFLISKSVFKSLFFEFPKLVSFSFEKHLQPKVEVLETAGLSRSDIGCMLEKNPLVLRDIIRNDVEKKVKYLLALNIDKEDLRAVFIAFPEIIGLDYDTDIKVTVDFLKKMGIEHNAVGTIVGKHPFLFSYGIDKQIKPLITYLKSIGISTDTIKELIIIRPSILGVSKDSIVEKITFLEGLGFTKGTREMVANLSLVYSYSTDILETQFVRMKMLGLSHADLSALVRWKIALLYDCDEAKLAKLDYLFNTMKLTVTDLIKFPIYLSYSLELRIRARHRVIEWLKSKQILRKNTPLHYMHITENRFVTTYVDSHPQARAIYEEKEVDVNM